MKYLSTIRKGNKTFYRIRKNYDGKEYQIFQSPSKEITLQVYKECQDADWEKEATLQIRDHYRENRPLTKEDQYITLDSKGGYRIQRWKNGRVKYYGKAKTKEHARKIRDHLIMKGWKYTHYQKRNVSPTKYIRRQGNKYLIRTPQCYYGIFNTFSEAVQYRKHLIAHNWEEEYAKIVERPRTPHHNIYPTQNGTYIVKKQTNGVGTVYATCKTLEEAISERDFFESIDWDWDLIDLY